MQFEDGLLGHGQLGALCVDQVQCIAVTCDFFFVSVLKAGCPKQQCRHVPDRSLHLDAVGRYGALGDGVFPKNLQLLWRLARE